MVIGIDGNEANVEHKVGVSVYTLELLTAFQKKANKEDQFKIFLRNPPGKGMPKENDFFTYDIVPGKILWSQIFLPFRLITKKDIDVFFAPAHYAPRFCPVPTVVTIHDLSFYYYPDEFKKKDLYQLKNWTTYSINHARDLIAVSKTTKKDITKWYDFPDSHIHVVYNGFEKKGNTGDGSTVLTDFSLKKNAYILYVGTVQPRKNIPVLLDAFRSFHKENPEYKLVIVGKKGWLYEPIYEKASSLNLEDALVFTDYLPDSDVVELYKNAFCFVLPSLYEGFGIPLLEAMSYGCPVISSHASSLPEIGNDSCLYFNPTDTADLVEQLNELAQSKALYQKLVAKGKKRVEFFSWEKCADETLSILKKTAL